MPRFHAPLRDELRQELVRLAAGRSSVAEITRALGGHADRRGWTRPSYARVHQLVSAERDRIREPSWADVVTDVAFHVRPFSALEEKATGSILRHLPEDAGIRRERERRRRRR